MLRSTSLLEASWWPRRSRTGWWRMGSLTKTSLTSSSCTSPSTCSRSGKSSFLFKYYFWSYGIPGNSASTTMWKTTNNKCNQAVWVSKPSFLTALLRNLGSNPNHVKILMLRNLNNPFNGSYVKTVFAEIKNKLLRQDSNPQSLVFHQVCLHPKIYISAVNAAYQLIININIHVWVTKDNNNLISKPS